MNIKAIGFDLDDTLYNREDYYHHIFNVMTKSIVNIDITFEDFYYSFQKFSDIEYEKFIKGDKSKDNYKIDRVIETYEYFGYMISREDAMIFDALYLYFRNRLEFRENVETVLERISQKDVELFILTNGASEDQRNKLNQLNLQKYVSKDKWFISDELKSSKPNAEIFKLVEKRLGFSGKEILYIGDNYINDIVGAKKNGWQTIFLNVHQYQGIESNILEVEDMKGVLRQLNQLIEK